VDPERREDLGAAAQMPAGLVEKYLGGRAEVIRMDAGLRETVIA
jgi:hypothetical protein